MKVFNKFLKYTTFFLLGIIGYLLVVTLLSYISVNDGLVKSQKEIPIYILTNGVHTDVVLPLKKRTLRLDKPTQNRTY